MKDVMTTKELAAELGYHPATLVNMRAGSADRRGKGPAWVKMPGRAGAVRYRRQDVEAWLEKHVQPGGAK